MSEQLVVISSDGHAGADLLDYRPYLEARWLDDFDAWAASYTNPWKFLDQREEDPEYRIGPASADSSLSWDSARRVEALEHDGIVGEVIFPNTATPFVPSNTLSAPRPQNRDDYEHRWAGLKAHNRWLADFCAEYSLQRAGVAEILLYDVEEAIEETRTTRAAGLRGGIVLPVDGDENGLTPLYYTDYEPLWDVCEELDVPVHRHARAPGSPVSARTGPGGVAIGMAETAFWDHRALAHIILSGVLERHPNLKFVFTETGMGWIPGELAKLDALFAQSRMPKESLGLGAFMCDALAELTMTPSEYFARNVWVGTSLMTTHEVTLREEVGMARLMWGQDYPHAEGSFPYSREAYRLLFSSLTDDEIRSILSEVAADVYNFDLQALQRIADRVGPTLDEIRTELLDVPNSPSVTFMVSELTQMSGR